MSKCKKGKTVETQKCENDKIKNCENRENAKMLITIKTQKCENGQNAIPINWSKLIIIIF